jgi:hypothetical protein
VDTRITHPDKDDELDMRDDEEELYSRFLNNEEIVDDQEDGEFNDSLFEDEYSASDSDEAIQESEAYNELLQLSNDIREQDQRTVPNASNVTPTSAVQLFLAHLVNSATPLTRNQYHRLTQAPSPAAANDEHAALLTLIQDRRDSARLEHPITERLCVVCHCEPRQCLLKPCRFVGNGVHLCFIIRYVIAINATLSRCFAICDDCRQQMAQKRFKNCPCCRRPVEGYCRIYVP